MFEVLKENNESPAPSEQPDTPLQPTSKKKSTLDYPTAFERMWEKYPRRSGKQAAFRKWKATLKEGATEDQLFKSVVAYAEECRKEDKEQQYIKMAKTFFGQDEWWREYWNSSPGQKQSDEEWAASQFGRA